MNKLYIFCGIPFSGKSTIAKKIVDKYGFIRIDLDEIKFQLFGINTEDKDIDKHGWDEIYKQMYQEIEKNLKNGNTVINDTGNFTKYERGLVKRIADKLNIETIEVFIDTPIEIARKRFMKNKNTKLRFDISEKDFDSAVDEMESPEGKYVVIYKYPQSIDKWIANNF